MLIQTGLVKPTFKEIWLLYFSSIFLFFKINFNKYIIQWSMEHFWDDAVHLRPQNVDASAETNEKFDINWFILKFSEVSNINKVDAALFHCPFKPCKA